MKTPTSPGSTSVLRRAGALILLALGVTGCLRPGDDQQALRDALLKATGSGYSTAVELGVGALPFHLARAGAALADLEPEPRAALRAVRSAGVGVYQLRGSAGRADRAQLIAAADPVMSRRGWERALTVIDGAECVVFYVPREEAGHRLRLCGFVLSGHELVVISGTARPEPLWQLAREQLDFPGRRMSLL